MRKRKCKKKIDGGKVFLGMMTGGLSLLATGIHEDPKPRKQKKSQKISPKLFGSNNLQKMDAFAYEDYIARQMQKKGYSGVYITPRSGDYGADVIGRKHWKKFCVQCKKYTTPVGVSAVQEIYSAKAHYGCDIAIVITTSTFTPAAVRFANEVGVKLIERNETWWL